MSEAIQPIFPDKVGKIDYAPIRAYLDDVSGVEYEELGEGGVFFIIRKADRRTYQYWPKSGKWRTRGTATIYMSRSIDDFIDRFVLRGRDGY